MPPSNQDLVLQEFDPNHSLQLEQLREFCRQCAQFGIVNNSSLEKMKVHLFAEKDRAKLWIVVDRLRGKVVGTSGAHHLPQISAGCFRVLFRGCILPDYRGVGFSGLSKKHLNSYIFRHTLGPQIEWAQRCGGDLFVVTTNVFPESTKTSDTNRIFHLLERQGLVRKHRHEIELFSSVQNVWEILPDALASV